MDMQKKIDYIIHNEGCEGGEGFSGLDTFLKYCIVGDFEEYKTLRKDLEPIVDYWYKTTKQDVDEQESYELKTFSKLPKVCMVYRDNSNGEKFTKIGNLLFDFEGNQVEYTNEENFKIEFTMSRYGVSS